MVVRVAGGGKLEEPVDSLDEMSTVDALASLQSLALAVLLACEKLATSITWNYDVLMHLQAWNSAKSHAVTGHGSRGGEGHVGLVGGGLCRNHEDSFTVD